VTTVPSKTATSAASTAGAIATGVVPSGSSAGGALLFAPPPSGRQLDPTERGLSKSVHCVGGRTCCRLPCGHQPSAHRGRFCRCTARRRTAPRFSSSGSARRRVCSVYGRRGLSTLPSRRLVYRARPFRRQPVPLQRPRSRDEAAYRDVSDRPAHQARSAAQGDHRNLRRTRRLALGSSCRKERGMRAAQTAVFSPFAGSSLSPSHRGSVDNCGSQLDQTDVPSRARCRPHRTPTHRQEIGKNPLATRGAGPRRALARGRGRASAATAGGSHPPDLAPFVSAPRSYLVAPSRWRSA
jgi:hypothetical protein